MTFVAVDKEPVYSGWMQMAKTAHCKFVYCSVLKIPMHSVISQLSSSIECTYCIGIVPSGQRDAAWVFCFMDCTVVSTGWLTLSKPWYIASKGGSDVVCGNNWQISIILIFILIRIHCMCPAVTCLKRLRNFPSPWLWLNMSDPCRMRHSCLSYCLWLSIEPEV